MYDSPEAVALRLLEMMLEREDGGNAHRNDQRTGPALLDLYAKCLSAANGNRAIASATMLH